LRELLKPKLGKEAFASQRQQVGTVAGTGRCFVGLIF
jgi:hypothetical protein